MPSSLLLSLLFIAVSSAVEPLPDDAPLLTDEEIEAINAEGMWFADKSLIEGKTLGDLRRHRHPLPPSDLPVREHNWGKLLDHLTLPPTFDSRTQWANCVHSVQDQGDCDGSWAMAAADVLSDRFCIQSSKQVLLSPQYLIDCQTSASGCDGGTAANAWSYLSSSGSVLQSCVGFTGLDASCPIKCTNGSAITKFKSTTGSVYTGIQSMQAAITQSGPIEACFKLYTDFAAYRSGIYVNKAGTQVGLECVRLVGWGVQGSVTYWIGLAYYGAKWGQAGMFYMQMGQTALGLETGTMAGNPSA